MTDAVLNPTQVSLSTPELPKRKPVVDLGTRMAHASMALAFLISYVTSESEYWRLVHVYSGYSLAAVLAFRLVWGWVGPASARWGLLLRRVAMWRVWLNKFKQGEWQSRNFWVAVPIALQEDYICSLAPAIVARFTASLSRSEASKIFAIFTRQRCANIALSVNATIGP